MLLCLRGGVVLVMGLVIVVLYYSGMWVIIFVEGSVCILLLLGVDLIWLVFMVGVGSCLLLMGMLVVVIFDLWWLECKC